MKKIVLIVFIIIVVVFAFVLMTNSQDSVKDAIKDIAGSDSSVFSKTCINEFNELYAVNKADLTQCSSAIRTGSFAGTDPTPKENNVVLIFDASGSMAGKVADERKIDMAKKAVEDFVTQLSDTKVQVSVVVYGHKGDNTDANKKVSCAGIEELYTFGSADGAKMERTLKSFEPTGWTPIADALEKAYAILKPYNTDAYNNSIVLISDGIETCEGDPVAVVQSMQERGLSVTANVIGFDVDDEASEQLNAIAENGNGSYFSAASQSELDFALQKQIDFMKKFDYRMQRVSENLQDINTATELHFGCVKALEVERAKILLDIYADERVTKECAEQVDDMYSEKYEVLQQSLWNSFDAMVQEFKQKSQ